MFFFFFFSFFLRGWGGVGSGLTTTGEDLFIFTL